MGLRITIDMCSGRPNPSWEITDPDQVRELADQLGRQHAALAELDSGFTGLGFRGVRVDITDGVGFADLPSSFELAGGGSKDASASALLAERLLDTIPYDLSEGGGVEVGSTQYANEVLEAARVEIRRAAEHGLADTTGHVSLGESSKNALGVDAQEQLRALADRRVSCPYDSAPFDPAYWNHPAIEPNNNCYAYAVGIRTDTFARPGLKHDYEIPSTMLGFQVAVGVYKDGLTMWGYPCRPTGTGRYIVALYTGAYTTGFRDFHFYRWHAEGYWSHKHAGNSARTTDASGHVIADLSTCDLGSVYTEYDGLFQSHNSVSII